MWVRLTFWLVLVVWIADILQPGYLQFYGWRNVETLAQRLQPSSTITTLTTVVPSPTTEIKVPTVPTPKNKIAPGSSACREPKNDFEEILSSTNVGCWRAPRASLRRH
jgi:hypothetical protein